MPADLATLRAQLLDDLVGEGVGGPAEQVAALARLCATLRTFRVRDDEIPVGDSKLGGDPDLPADAAWPEWQGKPLSFLAQLDLEEVAEYVPGSALPGAGLLSFFYAGDFDATGLYPEDEGAWRVIEVPPGARLARRSPPRAETVRFHPCAVEMAAVLSLPGDDVLVEALGLDPYDPYDVLDPIDLAREDGENQVLGFARPIQLDPALECVYAINGLYRARPFDVKRAQELEGRAAEWTLLFQLDSDDNAGMMWGDAGNLYFMIRQADLCERRWERVWLSFQCS